MLQMMSWQCCAQRTPPSENKLEKNLAEAQQLEEEPCWSVLADDLDVKRCHDKIQKLEEKSAILTEQNKILTAELKSLQEERDQDKVSLSMIRDALQTLKWEIEEAQLGLQHKDEIILQKDKLLKQSEETAEEWSNFIKDLRLTNRELRKQLEDRQDEASLAVTIEVAKEKEGLLLSPLSFAEEITQLASSEGVWPETSVADSTDLRHEDTDTEELLKFQNHPVDTQTQRCARCKVTTVQKAGLFLLFVFILIFLAFVVISITLLWNGPDLMSSPFFIIHYNTLPPI
ncbi:uncharacterized protein [Antennarius striatus]|uniref:uncharacterized protein isoform X2 n=1 Tax=Antennarius striatus TaxID=241820 RepID=UPI0035B44C76